MKFLIQLVLLFVFIGIDGYAQEKQNPLFEFRGVWVATVNNIDWPSAKNLTVEQQKAEFIELADLQKQIGMNVLIVQVRPAADAFFPSVYEPWSEFLTGKQGLPPSPYYDPLAFMITETHKRGMEFHAWLNPYRAVFTIGTSSIAKNHITHQKKEWFLNYGDKKYFNPALQEVRDYFVKIVLDIINRYDVDGIHVDDYFYPYKIPGKDFPDYIYYKKLGNGLSKEDWRRSNCDSIIKQLWVAINNAPRRVKFGVSPFGVWRNIENDKLGSNTKAGQTNYDDLYANILLWLKNGWMDYCVPQLYWERGHNLCDYDTLLNWWAKNSFERQMIVGHGLYKAGTTKGYRDVNELPNEIINLRNRKNIQGSAYFSSSNFKKNINGWTDSLQLNYYNTPAIVPPMPWINNTKPLPPIIEEKEYKVFSLKNINTIPIKGYVLLVGYDKNSATCKKIISNSETLINIEEFKKDLFSKIYIASISTFNNISDWVEVK
jgi:uncharacterized lipoprotein YddW (UPF0748 family)